MIAQAARDVSSQTAALSTFAYRFARQRNPRNRAVSSEHPGCDVLRRFACEWLYVDGLSDRRTGEIGSETGEGIGRRRAGGGVDVVLVLREAAARFLTFEEVPLAFLGLLGFVCGKGRDFSVDKWLDIEHRGEGRQRLAHAVASFL